MESFLIHTDIQKKWIRKFKKIESEFKARAAENDIQSRFPYENIEWLIKEGSKSTENWQNLPACRVWG